MGGLDPVMLLIVIHGSERGDGGIIDGVPQGIQIDNSNGLFIDKYFGKGIEDHFEGTIWQDSIHMDPVAGRQQLSLGVQMLGARFGFILKVCGQLVRLAGLLVIFLIVGFGVFLLRSRWFDLLLSGS